MKPLFLLLFFWVLTPFTPLCALDLDERMSPLVAIGEDGSITLADGSSYYTFSKGGGFISGPLGGQGRRLEGRWSYGDDDGLFTVYATCVRVEGEKSREDGFRRVRFRIGKGEKRSFRDQMVPAITEFAAYLLIEEFVTIPELPPLAGH